MNALLAALFAAALLLGALPGARAGTSEGVTFTQSYQVRAALGDIPTTEAVEPDGFWNVQEAIRLAPEATNATFVLPPGAELVSVACTCAAGNTTFAGDRVTFTPAANASAANRTVLFTHRLPVAAAGAFAFVVPDVPVSARSDALLLFYLPQTANLTGSREADYVLPTTSEHAGLAIYTFVGTRDRPLPAALYFVATLGAPLTGAGIASNAVGTPASAASAGLATPAAPTTPWSLLMVAAGIGGLAVLGGTMLASRLTGRHGHESRSVLLARERALTAALAEMEIAREAGEIDAEGHDRVRDELRAEAMKVIEALSR